MTDHKIPVKKNDFTAMRSDLGQGRNRGRRTRFKVCMIATASGPNSRSEEMAALAAGADFMPMLTENAGCRYSCRRGDCRLIPLTEMGWFITKTDG